MKEFWELSYHFWQGLIRSMLNSKIEDRVHHENLVIFVRKERNRALNHVCDETRHIFNLDRIALTVGPNGLNNRTLLFQLELPDLVLSAVRGHFHVSDQVFEGLVEKLAEGEADEVLSDHLKHHLLHFLGLGARATSIEKLLLHGTLGSGRVVAHKWGLSYLLGSRSLILASLNLESSKTVWLRLLA